MFRGDLSSPHLLTVVHPLMQGLLLLIPECFDNSAAYFNDYFEVLPV